MHLHIHFLPNSGKNDKEKGGTLIGLVTRLVNQGLKSSPVSLMSKERLEKSCQAGELLE
jgi:hypothetical protein